MWLNVCVFADLLTVGETAKEPPQDEGNINSPRSLSLEATFINHNFSQQVLKTVSVGEQCLKCAHLRCNWVPDSEL